MAHNCRVCGDELTDENWHSSFQKNYNYICKECYREHRRLYYEANKDKIKETATKWIKNNPDKVKEIVLRSQRKKGGLPMSENKECSSYFGVCVVERAIRHLFKNVERMPYGHPGYDFICSNEKKIDGKGACMRKDRNSWGFSIDNNTITDYFVLVAFDNREDLAPLHIWLIPGHVLNHLVVASISESTIDKWAEYEQNIDEAILCCDEMRGE